MQRGIARGFVSLVACSFHFISIQFLMFTTEMNLSLGVDDPVLGLRVRLPPCRIGPPEIKGNRPLSGFQSCSLQIVQIGPRQRAVHTFGRSSRLQTDVLALIISLPLGGGAACHLVTDRTPKARTTSLCHDSSNVS